MASFDPPPEPMRRQLDSLRQQTHRDWVCVISDDDSRPECAQLLQREIAADERFALVRGPRLGFYRKFERALAMASDSDLVALCDQDDRWRSDKLERLIAAIGGAELVYSDARVVRPDGEVVEPSYWWVRQNNHTDLASLALANSITGAAMLFRLSCWSTPCRSRRPTRPLFTTTGWAWWPSPGARSPTWVSRPTTTFSTKGL